MSIRAGYLLDRQNATAAGVKEFLEGSGAIFEIAAGPTRVVAVRDIAGKVGFGLPPTNSVAVGEIRGLGEIPGMGGMDNAPPVPPDQLTGGGGGELMP